MTALQGGVGLTEPPVESPVPPTPRLTWEPGPAPGPPLPGQVYPCREFVLHLPLGLCSEPPPYLGEEPEAQRSWAAWPEVLAETGGQEVPTGTRRSGLSASARGHSSPELSESHPESGTGWLPEEVGPRGLRGRFPASLRIEDSRVSQLGGGEGPQTPGAPAWPSRNRMGGRNARHLCPPSVRGRLTPRLEGTRAASPGAAVGHPRLWPPQGWGPCRRGRGPPTHPGPGRGPQPGCSPPGLSEPRDPRRHPRGSRGIKACISRT